MVSTENLLIHPASSLSIHGTIWTSPAGFISRPLIKLMEKLGYRKPIGAPRFAHPSLVLEHLIENTSWGFQKH